MITQSEKADRFRKMHRGPGIFVLPNAFDVASARILGQSGFEAIATTSGGCAFSLGYCDGENMSRDAMAAVVARIASAVDLPVNADMEAGYGADPDAVAETVRASIGAGAAGINIEDSSKAGARSLFEMNLAVERIWAARAAAEDAGLALVINARTDVFSLGGREDSALFEEATRRANAYLDAGADCAFVIGVRDGPVIGRLAEAVHGPLNVLAGAGSPSVAELESLGVRRVSVGSGFAKAALTAVRNGARELREKGTYEFTRDTLTQPEIHGILKGD